jgi:branched-chain amino acid transport system permease protein
VSQLLLFTCLGLGPGALIAGIALAIVLTYRGTGVVHLGSGAVAMIAAYVFYDLRNVGALLLPPLPFLPATIGLGTHSVAALPAFVITMAVCVVLGLVLEILVFRPVRGSSPLARLLVSLGVLIVLQAVAVIRFGSTGQSGVTVLPETPSDVVKIGSVPVPSDRFVLAAIVIFAAGALATRSWGACSPVGWACSWPRSPSSTRPCCHSRWCLRWPRRCSPGSRPSEWRLRPASRSACSRSSSSISQP